MPGKVCRDRLRGILRLELAQTNEGDDFRRFLGNLFPPELLLANHPRLSNVSRCREYWRTLRIEPQDLFIVAQRGGSVCNGNEIEPPSQRWKSFRSQFRVYVGIVQHEPALFHRQARLQEDEKREDGRRRKHIPRVRTPSVVDFPLSTFPTTAQRTSGTSETLRGGSRRSRCIRG